MKEKKTDRKTEKRNKKHKSLFSRLSILLLVFFLFASGCRLIQPRRAGFWTEDVTLKPSPSYIESDESIDSAPLIEYERNNFEVYRKAARSVVNITTVVQGTNWFLQLVPREGTGSGK